MAYLSWTTKLPSSWETKPLKAVASYVVSSVDKVPAEDELPVRLCNYTDVYKNEVISQQMELMQTTATKAEIEKFRLLKDDVVITKDSESWDDMAIPALVVDSADDLLCGYHLAILRPEQKAFSGRFLFRCLQAKPIRLQLELASTGVTRFGLPKDEIGKLLLPVPPLEAQRRIADYLDAEITQIDALIAEKKRMLALLAEKRTALVSRAVTWGINPNAPTTPSHTTWFDQVPSHWAIERLKWSVVAVDSGVSVNASDQPAEEGKLGVLKTSAVQGGKFFANENKEVWLEEYDRVACPVCSDRIIMSRMNTPSLVGESGYVETDHPELYLPDRLWQLTFDKNRFYTPYIARVLACKEARQTLSAMATGTSGSMKNLSKEEMLTLLVPRPPLEEQQKIIESIERQEAETLSLVESLKYSLALLKERRSALITAAVTGQIAPEVMAA